MTRLMSLIIALAVVMGTTACSGSPTAPPKVELCLDQNAQNYNGPAPCVPKPVPAVDSVTVKQFAPQPGPNTKLRTSIVNWDTGVVIPGDKLTVTSRFSLRQETVDEAAAVGEVIILVTCLSVNDQPPTPQTGTGQCMSHPVVATSNGEVNHSLGVDSDAGITQTSHVWVTFAQKPANANYNKVSRYFGGELKAAPVTWIPQ